MEKRSFTSWMNSELTSECCSLLTLYEKRDKMLYIDGPQLEQEYMTKVGEFEESVIREEIECELLRKKQQMLQAALNRREPIDESAIDTELERTRQQMLQEAAGSAAPNTFAALSDEELDELQLLYHDIVKNYHPQMHPELTQAHRELFAKAQDAYRVRDLQALRLIHDMLFRSPLDDQQFDLLLEALIRSREEQKNNGEKEEKAPVADYTLAAMVYGMFKPTDEEAALREECAKYRKRTDEVMQEMETMRQQFPYNAAAMLSDPEKTQAYMDKLAHRLRSASEERERRTQEIRSMMERMS